RPFVIAGGGDVQLVLVEKLGLGLAFGVGHRGERVDDGDVGSAFSELGQTLVEFLLGAGLGGGFFRIARGDQVDDDREVGIVGLGQFQDLDEVAFDVGRLGVGAEVIGADADDNGGGVEVQDVFLEPEQHAAADIAADAAVGDLHAG